METLSRRENFVRTNDAIYELFADILRDELSNQIPPAKFAQKINETSCTKLRKMHLSGEVIRNVTKTESYNGIDVTLLSTVLRNICNLSGQLAQDVEKIKNFRNKWCAHSPVNEMERAEFEKIWMEFENICRRFDMRTPNKGYLKRLHLLKDREALIIVKSKDGEGSSKVLKFHQLILESWQKQNEKFYVIRACREVEERLENESIITITGNIGAGKSAIAGHISLQYLKAGWKVFPVRNVRELESLIDLKFSSKQLFVLDNPVGKDEIDNNLIKEWKMFEHYIKVFENKKTLRVITTCRIQVLQVLRSDILLRKSVISLEEDLQLNQNEKRGILQCHLQNHKFTVKELNEIVQKTGSYFPLLCSLYGEEKEFQKRGLHFFLEPGKFIEEEITFYKDHDKKKFCALVLLIKNNGLFTKGTKWNEQIFTHFLKLFGLPATVLQSEISGLYDGFSGHLLKQEGNSIQYNSDFIMDIVSYVFGKDFPEELLSMCSPRFLRTHIFFEDYKMPTQCPDYKLFLTETHVRAFINRVVSSLTNNCLDICLCPALKSPMVKSAFVEAISLLDEEQFENMFFLPISQCEYPIPWPFSQKDTLNENIQNIIRNLRAFQPTQQTSKEIKILDIDIDLPLSDINHENCSVCSPQNHFEQEIDEIREIKRKPVKPKNTEYERKVILFKDLMTKLFQFVLPNDIFQDILIAIGKIFIREYLNDEKSEETSVSGENTEKICRGLKHILMNDKSIHTILKSNDISDLSEDDVLRILFKIPENQCIDLIRESVICIGFTNLSEVMNETSSVILRMFNSMSDKDRSAMKEFLVDFLEILQRTLYHIAKMQCPSIPYIETVYRIPTREYWMSHFEILLCNGFKSFQPFPLGKFMLYAFKDIIRQGTAEDLKQDMVSFSSDISPFKCITLFEHTEIFQAVFKRVNGMENEKVLKACKETFLAVCAIGKTDIAKNIYSLIQETAKCERWCFVHNTYDALQISSAMHQYETVSFLLSKDFDVNIVDVFGNTPLLLCLQYMTKDMNNAQKSRAIKVLKCLLKNGADEMHSNFNGFCALHLACNLNYPDIVALFLDANNVDKVNLFGDSPLFIASKHCNSEIIRMLYKRGANVNLQNKNGWSPLFVAAENGQVDVIRTLLEMGANVNLPDIAKTSPLTVASKKGHLEAVELLLNKNAYVHQKNINFESPAIWAAYFGHCNCLERLLQNGSSLHEMNANGENLLFLASKRGNFDTVKMLINLGADKEQLSIDGISPVLAAVMSNNIKITHFLLENGARINSYRNNIPPLHFSSSNGHEEMVELILQYGADVNDRDERGMTAIHAAVEGDNINIVSKLLEYDCSVNKKGGNLETALHIASRKGHRKLVDFLISRGGIVNKKNLFGETALHLAAANGFLNIVMELIEKGSNINECDYQNTSPLFMASQKGFEEIVSILLDSGADTELCDITDISPLITASANGHDEVVKRLLEYEVKTIRRDIEGKTALWYAAASGKENIVNKLLLESTAIVNIYDNDWVTPLMIAASNKHTKTVLTLLEYGSRISSIRIIYEQTTAYKYFITSGNTFYTYWWSERKSNERTRHMGNPEDQCQIQ